MLFFVLHLLSPRRWRRTQHPFVFSPHPVVHSSNPMSRFRPQVERAAKKRPIWMRLSAITPKPTQRWKPSHPLYRQRSSPWRRFSVLIRPSEPVRQRCPFLNQRLFCSLRRSWLRVLRLGTETYFTPISYRVSSLSWE